MMLYTKEGEGDDDDDDDVVVVVVVGEAPLPAAPRAPRAWARAIAGFATGVVDAARAANMMPCRVRYLAP